ncbi:MAG: hypothetical protein E6J04_07310 [Chloroflexi bacterium]|nr:MAG: hypothetical protein E6J04_07310 [Chloroflexota bacterium]
MSKSTLRAPTVTNSNSNAGLANGRANSPNRALQSPKARGPESLIWPVMVTLGCWGMAFSFLVFSKDANHVLFAGIAVLMALLWTLSVGVRIRKLLLLRQR